MNLSGGILLGGGLVAALGQPTTYHFSWAITVPTTPGAAASLASLAPSYATSTAYKLGAAVLSGDGRVYGCVTPGTSASTGTGPSGTPAAGSVNVLLACGGSLPVYTDGTVGWILLSNVKNVQLPVQALYIVNRDATVNWIDHGLSTGLVAGAGAGVGPLGGAWKIDGGSPENVFVIASSAPSAASVTVAV